MINKLYSNSKWVKITTIYLLILWTKYFICSKL